MYQYPHTIENGAGERLTFVRRARDERGEMLEAENVVEPGAGPPVHVHHLQEEALTVRSGEIGYQILGQDPQTASAGETVTFAPGVAHKFWNAGTADLRCTGWIRPPDNIEYFLTEIYASMRRNGGKRPGLFDAAYLLRRYRSEFDMLDIPAPVRRFVLPIVARVGSAIDLDRKFAGAPEPVRR